VFELFRKKTKLLTEVLADWPPWEEHNVVARWGSRIVRFSLVRLCFLSDLGLNFAMDLNRKINVLVLILGSECTQFRFHVQPGDEQVLCCVHRETAHEVPPLLNPTPLEVEAHSESFFSSGIGEQADMG
jgi:hypothetical protein